MRVARFTVSLAPELLASLDGWIAARGLRSRSQGVRELIREKLAEEAWGGPRGGSVVATLTYVYDHHKHDLLDTLAHLMHTHLALVVSTMHVHLDHQHCLETTVLKGPAPQVRDLAERIMAIEGILGAAVSPAVDAELLAERRRRHPGRPDVHHDH